MNRKLLGAVVLCDDPTPDGLVATWLKDAGVTLVSAMELEVDAAVLWLDGDPTAFLDTLAETVQMAPVAVITDRMSWTAEQLRILTSGPYDHIFFGTPTEDDLVAVVTTLVNEDLPVLTRVSET